MHLIINKKYINIIKKKKIEFTFVIILCAIFHFYCTVYSQNIILKIIYLNESIKYIIVISSNIVIIQVTKSVY